MEFKKPVQGYKVVVDEFLGYLEELKWRCEQEVAVGNVGFAAGLSEG